VPKQETLLQITYDQIHCSTKPLLDPALPCRAAVGPNVVTLPEMLFSSSRVTFLHKPSGIALDFTALSGLRAWVEEGLPPLEVRVAQVGGWVLQLRRATQGEPGHGFPLGATRDKVGMCMLSCMVIRICHVPCCRRSGKQHGSTRSLLRRRSN
jgi:hypothetical protein